jgi:Tol biopolymer transport system component
MNKKRCTGLVLVARGRLAMRWRTLQMAAGIAALVSAAAAYAQPFGSWQAAVNIDPGGLNLVNTGALEGCPSESPDGRMLFFATNREASTHGLDIWVAHRKNDNDPWGEPERLPGPVNSSANDFCPTPLPGGGLMFVSNRGSACGNGADIYQTRLHPVRGWLEPEHLGCEVNSFGNEFSPALVQAGGRNYLYFSSDRTGVQNIYVSEQLADGSWGIPVAVAELNAGGDAWRPNVGKDGREIVFDSTRGGGPPQIWSSTRPNLHSAWSEPVRLDGVNLAGSAQTRASLSWDGRRLYFGSNRPDGDASGDSDIYVATRGGPVER